MRKLVLVLVLLFVTSSVAIAQSIELNKAQLESQLCKRWTADYFIVGDEKVEPEEDAKPLIVMFNKDGSIDHIKTSPNDPNPESTWEYSRRDKVVNIYEGNRLASQIISISPQGMLIKMIDSEDSPIKNMKVHFVPM